MMKSRLDIRWAATVLLAWGACVMAQPLASAAVATIDPQAVAVFARNQQAMFRLKTFQADCDTELFYPTVPGRPARMRREQATLIAVKPNRMVYVSWHLKWDDLQSKWVRQPRKDDICFVCDGKTDWKQFGPQYSDDTMTEPRYLHTILEPWDGFYAANSSTYASLMDFHKQGQLLSLTDAGTEVVGGVRCDKVSAHVLTSFGGDSQEYWETWYMSRDGLIRRRIERIAFGGKPGYTRVDTVQDIRLNRPVPAGLFAYTPPPGVISEAEEQSKQLPLLAAGTAAPDFTAHDAHNAPVRLSDFRGKVVVIDFWASWCGPCVASMPHSQAVVAQLQAEGLPVVLLAVDNSEDRAGFLAWTGGRGAKYPALDFLHIPPKTDIAGALYHVTGIPTQYILDESGAVRASIVGYGGPTDELQKAIRGALPASSPAGE